MVNVHHGSSVHILACKHDDVEQSENAVNTPFLVVNTPFLDPLEQMVRTLGVKPTAWTNAAEFYSGDRYYLSRSCSLKALPNDCDCLIRMLPNRGVSPWKCKQRPSWSK